MFLICLSVAYECVEFSALTSPPPSCDFLQPTVTEDFGHLPPEQRRKRLQQKLEEISKELQKEVDQRCVHLRARVVILHISNNQPLQLLRRKCGYNIHAV